MVGAAFVAHANDPFSKKELALAYALVALVLLVTGPGRYSIDARLERKR
jgi:putative oxidoreductase